MASKDVLSVGVSLVSVSVSVVSKNSELRTRQRHTAVGGRGLRRDFDENSVESLPASRVSITLVQETRRIHRTVATVVTAEEVASGQ